MPAQAGLHDLAEKPARQSFFSSLSGASMFVSRRAGDNAGKRPDIALFNKAGAAIIIEFKVPAISTP